MIKVDDHVAEALGELPARFGGATLVRAVVSALIRPIQRLEDALWQVFTLTDIDTATDAALDLIGKLVKEPRDGDADEIYRRRIRARIAVNRSKMRVQDLIAVAQALLGSSATGIVHLQTHTLASATATIIPVIDDATAVLMARMLREAIGVGIALNFVYSSFPPGETFTLDTGPGFDDGHLGGE